MCVICKREECAKKVKGLDGGVCEKCYFHLQELASGDVQSARAYFDHIAYSTEDGALYVMNALEKRTPIEYITPDDADDPSPQTTIEYLSAINDNLASIKQNVSFLATVVLVGISAAIFAIGVVAVAFICK